MESLTKSTIFFYSSDRKFIDLVAINQNSSQHSTPGSFYQLTGVSVRVKTISNVMIAIFNKAWYYIFLLR